MNETDPRTALAEVVAADYNNPDEAADRITAALAESGVLLVTEAQYSAERLEFLYATHPAPSRSDKYVAHDRGRCPRECWDWIVAALSGEATA